MSSRSPQKLRNIGIIAHIDAGKTTVTERMLYCSGATHRVGEVDKGTTETDFDEEEQQRGITIYSACVTFPWHDIIVNLLDTPGHVDFTAEVERCLRVLDGAVVVFSAREGVEAQSETVWRQADKYRVPRVVFINKMDREGARFDATVAQIEKRLHAAPVPVQIPLGEGPPHLPDAFSGIIDLIEMKLLVFPVEAKGSEVIIEPIPEEERARAELYRESMLEKLYDYDNELMELALQEEDVPPQVVRRVLRDATLQQLIQPVFCGSALDGIGVPPLLDAVAQYLPSPLDRPPVEGVVPDPKRGGHKGKGARDVDDQKKGSRKPEKGEPFCGLVFKVLPAKTGDLCWVRVYSGELKANMRVFNATREKKENVAQLWRVQAARREQITSAGVGDIVGVIGLRDSVTGDTLCDSQQPIMLESILFPETVMAMAIEPESADERKKLADVLELLKRQDPTFVGAENEETGQTIISGMGELHLEVIKNRLLRDFKLNVKVHKPRVSYRESIARGVEVVGECHRQMGGQLLVGEVKLRVEPLPPDKPDVLVMNTCTPDRLDRSLIDAALDELRVLGGGGGVLGGFPLMRIRVTLLDGQAPEEGANEIAFRIAANVAFNKALHEAGPVLMEPIMRVEITTPEDHLGDFVGDVQQRRGVIVQTDPRGEVVKIDAHVPLAELFGYSSRMRSISQGRAGCTMQPLAYAPAPPEVASEFGV